MGYTTEFKGVLKFKNELKASELAYMKKFLGGDIRDHDEWEKNEFSERLFCSIDLELTDDFSGIQWNGQEKSYKMKDQVNYIISQMRKISFDFGLVGKFAAQGEDVEDRWELIINENGYADAIKLETTGRKIQCPHCGEYFLIDEVNQKIIA